MMVQILAQRIWQDRGTERVLAVGAVHELPDVVATSLVATGAARLVTAPSTPQTIERAVVSDEEPLSRAASKARRSTEAA